MPQITQLRDMPLSPEHLEKLRLGREKARAERKAQGVTLIRRRRQPRTGILGKSAARLQAARAEEAPVHDGDVPENPYGASPAAPGVDYDVAMGGRTADSNFAQQLATAIGSLVQSNAPTQFGPKPIPAALQAKRNKARAELEELLDRYEAEGERVQYEVITPAPGGFFIDDVLIPTGEVIIYRGVPNEGLRPLNRSAQAAMDLFLASIGGGTPDLATQSYEAYLNRPRHAEIQGQRPEAPIMGTPRTLRNASVEVMERPAGRYVGPNRVMGTVPPETPGQF